MGTDDGEWVRDTEPGERPIAGSWREVEEAGNLRLLTDGQVSEVLLAVRS